MRSYLATLEKSLTGILMMKEMANGAEDVANDFDIVNRIVKNEVKKRVPIINNILIYSNPIQQVHIYGGGRGGPPLGLSFISPLINTCFIYSPNIVEILQTIRKRS